MSTARDLLAWIERLSPVQREKAEKFVRSLHAGSVPPESISGADLLALAKAFPPDEADAIAEAIARDCERVDAGEW
jgi:hypothetical protein